MQLRFELTSPEPARRSRGEGGPTFVRHRRARRYILRVLDNGTLRVTLPRWGSKREALAFVQQSAAWIEKQLLKHESRPAVAHPDEPALRKRARKELPAELL